MYLIVKGFVRIAEASQVNPIAICFDESPDFLDIFENIVTSFKEETRDNAIHAAIIKLKKSFQTIFKKRKGKVKIFAALALLFVNSFT